MGNLNCHSFFSHIFVDLLFARREESITRVCEEFGEHICNEIFHVYFVFYRRDVDGCLTAQNRIRWKTLVSDLIPQGNKKLKREILLLSFE